MEIWRYNRAEDTHRLPRPYTPVVDENGLPHCGSYNCWCDGSCFPEWDEEERDDDEED